MGKLNKLKQVSFSSRILMYVDERTEEMGISFPEYIRHLVLNDIKHIRDKTPLVTEEEENAVSASMRDIKEGRFTVHKDQKAIREHFKKLLQE